MMRAHGIGLTSLLLAFLCAGLALGLRGPLTALMSLHMLVQIPLLVAAGVLAEQAWHAWCVTRPEHQTSTAISRRRAQDEQPNLMWQPTSGRRIRWSYNAYGIPGLLLVSLVGAGWMIPKALDDALVDWRVAAFKYVGLPICGWLLRASVRQANVVIKLFFLGNFCWMSAIVGMVYLDQPIRLCNAYLQDDQDWAGRGLIVLAIVLPSCWLVASLRPIWRFLNR
ncbi:hypothetical protein [Castellaniella sp.]|uniref:hypothetical protein n=1 Tax=Castellaniella sp. TaxID=1955812 RepID=UPI002AFFABAE|nr:hypothetical protein [Castellaniella sp.]